MKKILTISSAFLATLVLSACSSNPTMNTLAIQKADNQYEVTGLGKSEVLAKNNAVIAANKTCGKLTAIISDQKTTYNGALKSIVDEQTGKMIQAAASVLGTIAGKSADISKDDDYQTTLTFKCEAK
ncbi:hypothetical protein A6M14_05930 [Acinetobacter sp. Ac_877]|uniref:hypothetical protein n=1 Tax=Acinetobacter portensis TaxID=1839785 RepID=UPI00128B052C|nr:hypothetical protein [Acinetobacter portensis]MPW40846.1 hypothetical protein [Acinetobacter portensis]